MRGHGRLIAAVTALSGPVLLTAVLGGPVADQGAFQPGDSTISADGFANSASGFGGGLYGPDGELLYAPDEYVALYDADGNLLFVAGQGPRLYGPDGQPLYGHGYGVPLYGPDGQPLYGPDGQPLYGPANGVPLYGPDGQPLYSPSNGVPLIGPDGKTLIGPDGKPIYGPANGVPLIGPDGKTLIGPDGKPIYGPGGAGNNSTGTGTGTNNGAATGNTSGNGTGANSAGSNSGSGANANNGSSGSSNTGKRPKPRPTPKPTSPTGPTTPNTPTTPPTPGATTPAAADPDGDNNGGADGSSRSGGGSSSTDGSGSGSTQASATTFTQREYGLNYDTNPAATNILNTSTLTGTLDNRAYPYLPGRMVAGQTSTAQFLFVNDANIASTLALRVTDGATPDTRSALDHIAVTIKTDPDLNGTFNKTVGTWTLGELTSRLNTILLDPTFTRTAIQITTTVSNAPSVAGNAINGVNFTYIAEPA